jgi:hypothetical protein
MRAVRLLPLLLALAACESDPLGTAARNVEVRASLSPAAGTRGIDFDVVNNGWRTVYVAACDNRMVPTVQRRDLWDAEGDVNVFCLGIHTLAPVALEPGESARGSVPVSAPGEYRVVLVLQDPGDPEQHTQVASGGVIVP